MPDAPRPLPPKKEVALALLQREPSIFVHIDPRRPGVLVPKWFANQSQLTLQIGMNMTIPIVDLKIDDEGISCTLSFQRTPFWCRMPWASVWGLVGESHRGVVWPEDVPPEVVREQAQAGAQKPPAKRPRPHLAAVGSSPERGKGAEEPGAAKRDEAEGAREGEARDGEAQDGEARDGEARDGEARDGEARADEDRAEEKREGEKPAAAEVRAPVRLVAVDLSERRDEAAEDEAREAQKPREAQKAPREVARGKAAAVAERKGEDEAPVDGDAGGAGGAGAEGEAGAEGDEARDKSGARQGGGKPKRELPPYLRVIK
ncbi:hypothetical protein [Chondromyces apiculatus]|uniref:Stringent starvation protein B n=1 Tax=Chondromyces apiculatus DSM 436 TaxID=1192034 RepID=A0A017SZ86_9BACT|nr:hypothetical protein [Chondromyces apiculatus]EYF02314.1 Hypothetical protein CAP_7243 [Chondromyces apiculatus DSM 436]